MKKEKVQCKNCKDWARYLLQHFVKRKDCKAAYVKSGEIIELNLEAKRRKRESNNRQRKIKYDSELRKQKYTEEKFYKSLPNKIKDL